MGGELDAEELTVTIFRSTRIFLDFFLASSTTSVLRIICSAQFHDLNFL